MNIFKTIRRRYIDFLDYRDESEETFLNKKGKVVAIVTMCSPLSYLFHSIFHKKSHDVYASDEDFMRLYNVKRTPTPNPNEVSDDCWTLGDYLKSQNIDMNQIFNRRKQ